MRTSDFDFYLPNNLIAFRPLEKRDASRLLVLHKNGEIEHRMFSDVVEYMNEGDMLLLNNTKVFPARLLASRTDNKVIDILLIKDFNSGGIWEVMYKGKYEGEILIGGKIRAEVWLEKSEKTEKFQYLKKRKYLRFLDTRSIKARDIIWQYGYMPLPPYIKRLPDENDRDKYQTVYAEKEGSIAAPTAGLHFTNELIEKIEKRGILVRKITLHVGQGTFKPIKTEYIDKHIMDKEYFEIDPSIFDEIKYVKKSGGKIIATGTTTTRAIEGFASGLYYKTHANKEGSLSRDDGFIRGWTDIFIYPGYRFKIVDSIVTNFHLPKSTPLMLVSAFCGFDKLLNAYQEAIERSYRFFSFGDAMLVL